MTPRRLLVVTTGPADEAVLREEVRRHTDGEEVEIHVVAPATELSRLEWLASDEDRARAKAAKAAREATEAVETAGEVEETQVGDPDPVQAIEDALRNFAADELVIVTRPGKEATWLEKDSPEEAFQRFDLPVTHLVLTEHS
jgi:nucleotide-binding universal stress UspA family protein